jgi:hypothetical protein
MPNLEMVKRGYLGNYIHGGDPRTWCPNLWTWAVRQFNVRSVLDVGCGEGHSTRFFRTLGCDVTGVEGCAQALRDGVIPDCLARHDFCDGAYLPPLPPDMIWSCNFLEHAAERYIGNILETFAEARKLILLTYRSSEHDGGHSRPGSYWIGRIEDLGFRCSASLSRHAREVTLRDYTAVNHFARSGLVFVRRHRPRPDGFLEAAAGTSRIERWQTRLRAWWKALSINVGFGLSPILRAHRQQHRALRRAARQEQ